MINVRFYFTMCSLKLSNLPKKKPLSKNKVYRRRTRRARRIFVSWPLALMKMRKSFFFFLNSFHRLYTPSSEYSEISFFTFVISIIYLLEIASTVLVVIWVNISRLCKKKIVKHKVLFFYTYIFETLFKTRQNSQTILKYTFCVRIINKQEANFDY